MAEYIECRKCDSSYCDGCNTLTLSKMLHARKFDCLLDEHHCINPCADVEVVKHGRWIWKDFHGDGFLTLCCSECLGTDWARETAKFCSECGAKMEVDDG